jgi:hypothetical protein
MTTNDDFDMPDLTDEMVNEFQQLKNVDLHLGVPEVKPLAKSTAPPVNIGLYALDTLVALLASCTFWLTFAVWQWIFFT